MLQIICECIPRLKYIFLQNIAPLNRAMGRKIAVLSKFEGFGHFEFGYARQGKVFRRILKIDQNYN